MSGWKEDDVSKVGVTWEFVGLMDDTKAVSVVDMGGVAWISVARSVMLDPNSGLM